jgi:hypothetical protein
LDSVHDDYDGDDIDDDDDRASSAAATTESTTSATATSLLEGMLDRMSVMTEQMVELKNRIILTRVSSSLI